MDADEPLAEVARRLVTGGRLVRHWPLQGGVSAWVDGMEVHCPDGTTRRLVLRRHRSTDWKHQPHSVTRREHDLLAALHGLGMAVPEPLFLDESCDVLPSPYLVMEFVEGTSEIDDASLAPALREMAEALTRLHALDLDTARLPELNPREDPAESLPQYLPANDFGDRIRSALETRSDPGTASRASLLHGDFWPGNLLWNEGRLAAVLDWEDAAIGDPLSDLACARVELLCAYGDSAMEAFTDHYAALAPVDPRRLPLWELYVSVAALASMASWGLDAEVEAARRQATTRFMERAAQAWLRRDT